MARKGLGVQVCAMCLGGLVWVSIPGLHALHKDSSMSACGESFMPTASKTQIVHTLASKYLNKDYFQAKVYTIWVIPWTLKP